MSKRDYKTYNVLGKELAQEGIHGDNKCTEAQEVAIQSTNEDENKVSGIGQVHEYEVNELSKTMGVNESIDKNKQVKKEINKNKNKNIGIHNNFDKEKSIDRNETQEEIDMTFSGYKNYYQTKERSKLVKWSLRIAKLILIIMLLPLIATVTGTVALFIGGFLTAIVIPIGVGIAILGAICFMSTQVHASLIALGISASVTALALGGILLILFCMLMKWIIGLFKKYKKPRNQSMKREER